MVEQFGADGQAVTAGQLFDLADIAETGAHDHGLVVIGLVVVVDARDRLHARIFRAHIVSASGFLVPVVDAPHERRNQEHPGVGTGHGLGKGKQQGQVGLDAFALQFFRRTNTFPGRRQLDQHAITANTGLFVQVNQLLGLGQRGFFIKGQARIHLGGNPPRNHLQDTAAHGHGKTITGQAHIAVAALHGLVQLLGIHRHGRGLEQQGRVGGGVDRLETGNGIDVAGVGNNSGVLFQLFELGSHVRALSCAVCSTLPERRPPLKGCGRQHEVSGYDFDSQSRHRFKSPRLTTFEELPGLVEQRQRILALVDIH
ncbi:hypothetical protein D3C84_676560 [compost metagenome]